MTLFTIVLSYYENPNMLKENIRIWNTYSKKVKENIKIILVDDGSPVYPAEEIIQQSSVKDIDLELFRIIDDKKWNQDGARNLAMKHAHGFCLLSDIDHILDNKNAENLIDSDMKWKEDTIYFINRIFTKKSKQKLGCKDKIYNDNDHNLHFFINVFFIHTDLYWKIGGYDESYVGYYGSDRMFRKKIYNIVKKYEWMPKNIMLWVYTSADIHDSYTSKLDRTVPSDETFMELSKKKIPLLNFEWKKIL